MIAILQKKITRIRKITGRSIEERSEVINKREEVGHFEINTVVGKRERGPCLLVLTDRKSRFELIWLRSQDM